MVNYIEKWIMKKNWKKWLSYLRVQKEKSPDTYIMVGVDQRMQVPQLNIPLIWSQTSLNFGN